MPILDHRGELIGRPATRDYRQFPERPFQIPRDLPNFDYDKVRRMLIDPTVRLALAMRAAPLHQAEFAYEVPAEEGKTKWVPGVQADDPWVADFVWKQLKRIWRFDLYKLLKSQIYGWSACEVTMRLVDDRVHVDRLLHRHARDTIALMTDGEQVGVRFNGIKSDVGYVDLPFPRAVWHAYDPETESAYGMPIILGAYSPWCDKWLNGGALDSRRTFAYKYAYGGTEIGYPDGTTYDPQKGKEIPNRDIARMIVEQALNGAVLVKPSELKDGHEMWPITHPNIPTTPTHVYDYPGELDNEMMRGMEIPDDVIAADTNSGAWQGKQVPLQAFFTNGDRWLCQVVQSIVTQVLEPLVLLNTGHAADFEVTTKPLAQQALEQISATENKAAPEQPSGGGFMGGEEQTGVLGNANGTAFGRPVNRFALDAEQLVGTGVLQASTMVTAARSVIDQIVKANRRMDPLTLARDLDFDENETRLLVGSGNGR